MAKKSLIETTIAADFSAITLKVEGAGAINITVANLSDELRARALAHGLVQKISDAAAIKRDDLTGDPLADAKTKFAAMEAVANRLIDGEWAARNGDGTGPVSGIIYLAFEQWALAKATSAKKPLLPAAIRAAYAGKDRAGQLALRNVPEIAAIIEEIKVKRGAGKTVGSGDALLADLGL